MRVAIRAIFRRWLPVAAPAAHGTPPPLIQLTAHHCPAACPGADSITTETPMNCPRHEKRLLPIAALTRPGLSRQDVVRLGLVHLDPIINRAVQVLAHDLHRLIDASSLGLIAWAVDRSGVPLSQLTAADLTTSLKALADQVGSEIEAAGLEHRQHNAAFRDAFAPIARLRAAVGNRVAEARVEAQLLRDRLLAMDRYLPDGVHNRDRALRALLSPAECAAIGLEDAATSIAEMNARLAKLDALLLASARFEADGFDVSHLAGLGFDAEIEAAGAVAEAQAS
jgi:hypothetical protein